MQNNGRCQFDSQHSIGKAFCVGLSNSMSRRTVATGLSVCSVVHVVLSFDETSLPINELFMGTPSGNVGENSRYA